MNKGIIEIKENFFSGNLVEKKPINGEKLLTHHTSHAIAQSLTNLT
jgi:hypothetical protein